MAHLFRIILLVIATFSVFTMYKQKDFGYLNLGLGKYFFETSLLLAGGALLIFILLLPTLIKAVSILSNIFDFFGANRKTRLVKIARTALTHGLIELAEGRFEKAEKMLLKHVKYSDNTLLTYLSAARAAQQQGEHERRDDYLRKAHDATPTAEIAIGLTKAELQIDHEQYEQALANLTHLYELSPKHAYVIKLLLKTYRQLTDWKSLQQLLIDTKKYSLLSKDELHNLELETWYGLLADTSLNKDLAALTTLWKKLPTSLKSDDKLIKHYADLLLGLDCPDRAEQVIHTYLKSNWSENLIVFYAELDVTIDNKQLEEVESWLQEHQHNAHLLLALGKFCLNKTLWGKAQQHLEASLSIQAMPETYLKLAQLLEQHMDEKNKALSYYQLGLECLAGTKSLKIKNDEKKARLTADNEQTPNLKIVQSDNN